MDNKQQNQNNAYNQQAGGAQPQYAQTNSAAKAANSQQQQAPGKADTQPSAQKAPATGGEMRADDTYDAGGYGTIGVEEVDVLLMEDEDALDYPEASMYMDTTDNYGDGYADGFIDGYTDSEYREALDTVDMYVAENEAGGAVRAKQDDNNPSGFASGACASGVSPQASSPYAESNTLGADDDCGC